MKYKIPSLVSFSLSAAGIICIAFSNVLAAQIFLALSVPVSIIAYKKDGGRFAASTNYVAAAALGYIYFKEFNSPLLAISVIIALLYNSFMELYFEALSYSAKYFRLIIIPIMLGLYVAANIIAPGGWQTWTFPAIVMFFMMVLSFAVTMDIFALAKASTKYISLGNTCPEFNLPNEEGKPVSSKDFLGNPLLIIFVRGDWCPGCHIMLRSYQRNREKFLSRNVQMVSIGPDPFGINKEMVQKLGLQYQILSDETQAIAKQFCVELQKAVKGTTDMEFIPLPASFLIDKDGVVRYSSRPEVAGEFLYPDKIFEVLDALH